MSRGLDASKEKPIRQLGPYDHISQNRLLPRAARMAAIQTVCWHDWAQHQPLGLTRAVIRASLESDTSNNDHMTNRERRLREAMGRNVTGVMVNYYGIFNSAGMVVGFGKAEEGDDALFFRELDVLPPYQGNRHPDPANRYLMRQLMLTALKSAQNPDGITALKVLEPNKRARELYKKIGFEETGNVGSFDFEDYQGEPVLTVPHIEMAASIAAATANLGRMLRA